jgi:hypothetical protein
VAAARAGAATLAGVIRSEREVLLGELHALRAQPRDEAVSALLVEGAGLQVEARLRLLELAEEDAGALIASGRREVAQLVRVDDAADGVHGAA